MIVDPGIRHFKTSYLTVPTRLRIYDIIGSKSAVVTLFEFLIYSSGLWPVVTDIAMIMNAFKFISIRF